MSKHSDYSIYGRYDTGFMHRFQKRKDALLAPLTHTLQRWQISPAIVSTAGVISILIGTVLALRTGNQVYFLTGLILHVFGDALDGALARLTTPKPHGTLVDTIADSVGIVTSMTYFALSTGESSLAITFTLLYAAVTVIALRRSARQKPLTLIIRPRLAVYAALILDIFMNDNITPIVVLTSCAILLGTLFAAFKETYSSAPSK